MSNASVKTPVKTHPIDQDSNELFTISKQNKILTNAEKGTTYEKFVCDHINNTMDDTVAYLWKDVPINMLIECKFIPASDKNIDLCKNVLHDIGIDIVQKNTKTNKFTFIQCKNFISSLCIKHLSGYCCVMMQSKHLDKDCVVYVSNDKISHYLKKQLENDARHTFVHLPMHMKNTIEETEINFEIAKNKKVNNKSYKLEQLVCELCGYSTDRSTDLERHNKTKRHITKILEQKQLQNNVFNCSYCDKSFTAKTNMYRHQKYNCTFAPQNNTTVQNNINVSNVVTTQNSDITYLYEILNKMENKCLKLEDQNDKLLDLAIKRTKTIEKPNRYITYAMNHLTNAQQLKLLEKHKAIELLTDDNNISKSNMIETFITKHENKSLYKYFGDILIKAYETDDFENQSFWNVGATNLHFIIKEKGSWINDKFGVKLTKLIINPLLKNVEAIMNKYYKSHCSKKYEHRSEFKLFTDKWDKCREIIKNIYERELHKKILKYIGSQLKFGMAVNNNIDDSSSDSG